MEGAAMQCAARASVVEGRLGNGNRLRTVSYRVTIVDVARAASVAVSTASNALNGKGRMSDATRARIVQVADELGFRPHRAARGLPNGMAMAIGMRFDHEAPVPVGSFFIEALDGAARAAGERGYGLLISTTDVDETGFIDGLVVVDPADDREIHALVDQGLPVVTIGRVRTRGSSAPWVDVDHAAGVRVLLEHLASDAGRDGEAWLVSQAERYFFVRDLEDAFDAWCRERDRVPVVLRIPDQPRAAAEAVQARLDSGARPDLVVTVVERQAVGVHAALTTRGCMVPIGSALDDDSLGWLVPPVSALALDAPRHGRQAIEMLFKWLTTDHRPENVLLPARLVAR